MDGCIECGIVQKGSGRPCLGCRALAIVSDPEWKRLRADAAAKWRTFNTLQQRPGTPEVLLDEAQDAAAEASHALYTYETSLARC